MAELTEQQESPVGENKHPPRSRGGFWFGVTVLLLVIGLAGAGFFLFTQLRAKQDDLGGEVKSEMTKQLGGYQSQLAAIQSQIAALQTDIASKDAHFNKTVADFSRMHDEKLDSTRKELNNAIVMLQRQLGKTRGDWLIADAEYLLSVANERLYLIGDVNTTRQALEAADQRLRESGDASAFKVRDQVIKDIAALTNVHPVDVVGMYSAIQALEARINNLVLLLPYAGKTPEISPKPDSQPEVSEQGDGTGLLDAAKNKLNEIITIKHTDQPVKEILTPEQAQFIREQLRVKLEVVKVALVQQNEPLYQAGLLDTKKWVEQQFSQDNDSKAFIAELSRFEAIKLRSHFPDISLSLKMLRDITKLRMETDKAIEPVAPINSSGTGAVDTEKPTDAIKAVEGPQAVPAPETTEAIQVPTTPESASAPVTGPPPAIGTAPSATPMAPAGPVQQAIPPVDVPVQVPEPQSTVDASPGQEPIQDDHSAESQPVGNSENNGEAPKEEASPVTKMLEKIKQYLPGKH